MQVSAGEVLAQSMMALLPGIDANDEHKAQAVFRFYVVALSSLPVIQVRPAARPPSFQLYTLKPLQTVYTTRLCNEWFIVVLESYATPEHELRVLRRRGAHCQGSINVHICRIPDYVAVPFLWRTADCPSSGNSVQLHQSSQRCIQRWL